MKNWFKGVWYGIVSISKKVLAVFSRALSSFVAREAAQYYGTVLALVLEAENRGGSGTEKYQYVRGNIRSRLESQFRDTPQRALNFAIEMAVAEISKQPTAPASEL